MRAPVTLLAAWLMLGGAALAQPAEAPAAGVRGLSSLPVADEGSHHYLRDMDGDGALDLVRVDADGLGLRRLGADGRFPDEDDDRLAWPGDDLGWTLDDLDGDGAVDLVLVPDGRQVLVHRVVDGRFDEGRVLLDQPEGQLPRGVRMVPCVRDVDGDGRQDVVLPGRGVYLIHRAGDEGLAEEPVRVRMEARIEVDTGDRGGLHGRFGQELDVPWLASRDVDGDGAPDLVTQTEDRALIHLARPELSTEPSWQLDLAALKDQLGEARIDLDDLLRTLGNTVGWRTADLDGVPPDDLIIKEGSSLRVHLGGAASGPVGPPDRLLKSSGSVLYYTVRDVLGDELPDLQILRGDVLSVTDAVRMLAVPGALHFDVFTYVNEGGLFARSPTRRTRLTLETPRLLAFLEELEQVQETIVERMAVPARLLDLDGDGQRDDAVDLLDGELRGFHDALPADWRPSLADRLRDTSLDSLVEAYVLADLDALEDGGVRTVRLEDITEARITPGYHLRRSLAGRTPDLTVPTAFKAAPEVALQVGDLDGDGREDVILSGKLADGGRLIQTVVLGPDRD